MNYKALTYGKGKTCRRLLLSAGLFLLYSLTPSAMASPETPSVLLIGDGNRELMQSFSNQLEETLNTHGIAFKSTLLEEHALPAPEDLQTHDLIITLGSSTADKLLEMNIRKPMLSTLIPQQTYQALRDRNTIDQPWSALLIDQPVKRQLLLIKHLFGKQEVLGTILGPYSAPMEQELRDQSRALNQNLIIEQIKTTDELSFSLNRLNSSAQVLLAIPDPVAFNKNTIRSILLSTYRHKIPVIGFSQSYVKAGAIASLHTDIPQIAQQTADLSRQFLKTGRFSSAYYYPIEFNVSLNTLVASSLNRELPEPEKIIQLIKRDEAKP